MVLQEHLVITSLHSLPYPVSIFYVVMGPKKEEVIICKRTADEKLLSPIEPTLRGRKVQRRPASLGSCRLMRSKPSNIPLFIDES